MSTYSKRIKLTPDVLLEYTFDDTNYRSEDYQVLTNLKEKTKSYLSESTLNNQDNSLLLVDPILSKYSTINTGNFNFLKLQDFFTSPVLNDKMKLYFPSGFDFAALGYLGFYVNVYTYGFENSTKYSLSNFYYVITNINTINIFDLPNPFYFDEKYWVRAIELEFPSVNTVANDRIISGQINVPQPDTINENLTYGEGLSSNTPIFIDFAYISSTNTVLNVPYYYTGDISLVSIPQVPEFTELGVSVLESTQGDYFEIFATYLGSNENMDEFEYKQELIGVQIELDYIVSLYEENILTSTQTYVVTKDNVTQKILYRPIIQFSNTTAAIDVELRIVNLVDGSYISKFGSLGITNSLNKYGLRLTRLNMDVGVVNAEIFNVKIKNTMTGGVGTDSFVDVMKVPYPVMVDRYRILTKTSNASTQTNDYVPNGLLEILITSFDNVIEFNIAQDINSKGEPVPYDLSTLSTNSNLKLVFKSDSEKLEKDPFFEADNNYEIGNISFKISEKDYKVLRRIYDKGYDNFYLVVAAANSTTQLYSGKYLFYEDVTFINGTTGSTGTSNIVTDQVVVNTENVDSVDTNVNKKVTENNPFAKDNMPLYTEDPNVDKNYTNLLVYVRFQTNIDKMDAYLRTLGITPEIKYGNMYFLKRIYYTTVVDIKSQDFIEKVFEIALSFGVAPKTVKSWSDENKNLRVYVTPPENPTKPNNKPYTPPKPSITI